MIKSAGIAIGLAVMSFGAFAANNHDDILSDTALKSQAALICSAPYRLEAAKPDFKINNSMNPATNSPFNQDVLTAYRSYLKAHPGNVKTSNINPKQGNCTDSVVHSYRSLFGSN